MNFARKCSESEKERATDIFKKTEKIHRMITRNEEIYEVKYAKTERLKKSTIPYLQRLLNSDERKTRRRPG